MTDKLTACAALPQNATQ